jgi:hypothetical protein
MSGRSGYRKTDRKRNRRTVPRPKSDYVIRFVLPEMLAFALSPGEHGWGVTIGLNDIAFVTGQNPAHCCQLAADFIDKANIRQWPQTIEASVVKLLPCPAHSPPIHRGVFKSLTIDVEAIHDNVSRNAIQRRPCTIVVSGDAITFVGVTPKRLVHDFADERRSDRRRT